MSGDEVRPPGWYWVQSYGDKRWSPAHFDISGKWLMVSDHSDAFAYVPHPDDFRVGERIMFPEKGYKPDHE